MRRTLIILFSIVLLIALGVGAYVFFFENHARVVVAPTPNGAIFPTSTSAGNSGGTKYPHTLPTSTTTVSVTSPYSASSTQPRLVQIAAGPVVPGIVVFDKSTSTTAAAVRYIDRRSGNVYNYNTTNGSISRVSNKTLPGIERATWLSDGSTAYVQYFSTSAGTHAVQTYALPANGIGGFFLPQDLAQVAALGSKAILIVASSENGSAVTYVKPDDSNSYSAFQTPLSSVVVSFAGDQHYLMYTKPSSELYGYAFLVNKKTGAFKQIAGPLLGLVARTNHAGTVILISYTGSQGKLHLALVNVKTHTTIELPVSTIADKCVWTADDSTVYCGIPQYPPTAAYPDDWYQGVVSFTDQIWKIDVSGRYARLVLNLSKETGKRFDITSLAIDPKNTTLSFINKVDGSLWKYTL